MTDRTGRYRVEYFKHGELSRQSKFVDWFDELPTAWRFIDSIYRNDDYPRVTDTQTGEQFWVDMVWAKENEN